MSDPTPTDPDDADGPGDDATASDGVNKQIVDAVLKSTAFAFGNPGAGGVGAGTVSAAASAPTFSVGTAISYQKVAQATALAVQDATDYQRDMLSINGTAQGKALAMMFEDAAKKDLPALEQHAVIFVLSLVGSLAAGVTFGYVGGQAAKVLEEYPQS